MKRLYPFLVFVCYGAPIAVSVLAAILVYRHLGGFWIMVFYLAIPGIITGTQAARHRDQWWFVTFLTGSAYALWMWPAVLIGAWMVFVERPRLAQSRQ